MRIGRVAAWVLGSLLGLIVLLVVASYFMDGPIRRTMERHLNAALPDYSVRLGGAHLQLLGGALTLRQLEIHQKAHPDPAVLVVPRLRASVQWSELFTLHLVADFLLDRPVLYLNLPQLQTETSNPKPLNQRGWQQAVEAIYPLKINLLRISDGTITYVDEDPQRPLKLTRFDARAGNIRNIHSKDHVYPSTLDLETVIFDTGRGTLKGHADFLAEPFPGVQAAFTLTKVPLDRFRPVVARSNISVRGGLVSVNGDTEFAPKVRKVHLADVKVDGIHVDYIHTAEPGPAAKAAGNAAKQAANPSGPQLQFSLDKFELHDSDLGLVNKAKDPDYRVFVSGADFSVTGMSNDRSQPPAQATLTGKFMGVGATKGSATYRATDRGPDLGLKLGIEATPIVKLNDLLRAHGNFDVAAGEFSMYTELTVKNGAIDGYVKPLFADMKVTDRSKERGEKPSLVHKVYVGIVQVVAKILENKQKKDVATVAQIHGRIDNPRASLFQVLGGLLENAFFKAILPGFETEATRLAKRGGA